MPPNDKAFLTRSLSDDAVITKNPGWATFGSHLAIPFRDLCCGYYSEQLGQKHPFGRGMYPVSYPTIGASYRLPMSLRFKLRDCERWPSELADLKVLGISLFRQRKDRSIGNNNGNLVGIDTGSRIPCCKSTGEKRVLSGRVQINGKGGIGGSQICD